MLASPINPSDLMFIRGNYTVAAELPGSPGFEGVGIVEENGGGLLGSLFKGKRVAVLSRKGGGWSESVTVPTRQVIPLDKRLSLEQAATFFVNPATAFVLTRNLLNVPDGGTLVQSAAGSALGRMVIRLGRHFGFRTVNIVRSESQAEELKKLGADTVIVHDSETAQQQELTSQLQEHAGDDGVRYAIDPVGGQTASAIADALGADGRLILFGTLSDQPISFSPRSLMTVGAQVEGFWLGQYMLKQKLLAKMKLIRKLTDLILSGVLETDAVTMFPQMNVLDAIEHAESRGRTSKSVLQISDAATS